MKSFTSTSALALLSSVGLTLGQSQSPYFHLAINHYQSPPVTKGIWLSSFHTGAGESTIVTQENQTSSSIFSIQGGALVENSTYPYVVSLLAQAPYMSDAPEGYNYIAMNIGSPENGSKTFTYNWDTGRVSYDAKDVTFAICNVNATYPYPSVGPESQLLWRSVSTSTADTRTPPRCADVTLVAAVIKDTYRA